RELLRTIGVFARFDLGDRQVDRAQDQIDPLQPLVVHRAEPVRSRSPENAVQACVPAQTSSFSRASRSAGAGPTVDGAEGSLLMSWYVSAARLAPAMGATM